MFPKNHKKKGPLTPQELMKLTNHHMYLRNQNPQDKPHLVYDDDIIKNMLLAAATLRFPGLEFATLGANHVLIKNDVFNHLHAQEYVRKDQEQHRRIDQDLDKCFIILLRELKNGGPRAQLRSKL